MTDPFQPKYISSPGSFTKNPGFALYGVGLSKLYDSIRAGFNQRLADTRRDAFRSRIKQGQFGALEYWVPNFFLFNGIRNGQEFVMVDEVAANAISKPWSKEFDLLAIASFHLNLNGRFRGQKDSQIYPTAWAVRFLRRNLDPKLDWTNALASADAIEKYLQSSDLFAAEGARKVATNYHFFLSISGLLPSAPVDREEGFDRIRRNLIFLVLDRLQLSYPKMELGQLCNIFPEKIVSSALGVDSFLVRRAVADEIEAYLDLGGRARHGSLVNPAIVEDTPIKQNENLTRPLSHYIGTEFSLEFETKTNISRKRNKALSSSIKEHYENRCMLCRERLIVDPFLPAHYSEAAHIRPLGVPHHGDDTPDNLLVLCPNHHKQFDAGAFTIILKENDIQTKSELSKLDGVDLAIKMPHFVNVQNANYHYKFIYLKDIDSR